MPQFNCDDDNNGGLVVVIIRREKCINIRISRSSFQGCILLISSVPCHKNQIGMTIDFIILLLISSHYRNQTVLTGNVVEYIVLGDFALECEIAGAAVS